MNYALLKRLKDLGWNQKDLERKTGIDRTKISRIVNGIWNPTDKDKQIIAKALKTNPEAIFDCQIEILPSRGKGIARISVGEEEGGK